MSEKARPESKPKHRWYQYSLGLLFVLVTVVAIGCDWFRCKMVAAERQREAVEAIRELECPIEGGGKTQVEAFQLSRSM